MDLKHMVEVVGMHLYIVDVVNTSRSYIICPHSLDGLIGCKYH